MILVALLFAAQASQPYRCEEISLRSQPWVRADHQLAVSTRPSGDGGSEVFVWSPYWDGIRSLQQCLRGRGMANPPEFESVHWVSDDGSQMIVSSGWYATTRPAAWFVELPCPTMLQCLKGDFSCDGDVDQEDFGLLQRELGTVTSSAFDLNRDGRVNQEDVCEFEELMAGTE